MQVKPTRRSVAVQPLTAQPDFRLVRWRIAPRPSGSERPAARAGPARVEWTLQVFPAQAANFPSRIAANQKDAAAAARAEPAGFGSSALERLRIVGEPLVPPPLPPKRRRPPTRWSASL